MNSNHAMSGSPRFALVQATPPGVFGTNHDFGIKVDDDSRYPYLVPSSSTENLVARYGGVFNAMALLNPYGEPRWAAITYRDTPLALTQLFQVRGSLTVTDRRLIGTGTTGTSLLGGVDVATGTQLHFSVDLADIFAIHIVVAHEAKGPSRYTAIRLVMENHGSVLRLEVNGRFNEQFHIEPTMQTARLINSAACRCRWALTDDPAEQQRLTAIADGSAWETDAGCYVSRVRHADDVPEVFFDPDRYPDGPPIVVPRPIPTAPQLPAGWHREPDETVGLRYWDGTQWTEHRAPPPPPSAPAGWYADPESAGQRYWNGTTWT